MGKILKFIASPITVPLRTLSNAKNVVKAVGTDFKSFEKGDEKEEFHIDRPDDWEILASQSAKRSRRFWFGATAVWLFFSYKLITSNGYLLAYNLFFFALILAVFAIREALSCAQIRSGKKVSIRSLFANNEWFPAP